jgi:hypothetical protein
MTIALTFDLKVNEVESGFVCTSDGSREERWVLEDRRPITIRWGREHMP